MSASVGRLANVSGAVLVGGASTRMGRDKSQLEIGGVPGAVRVARVLDALFEDVLLVGGEPPREAVGGGPPRERVGRRVPDGSGPVCALRGLVAALEHATTQRVFVAATDMPLLNSDLITALVAWPEADAVVPRTERGAHPLCALYRVDAVLPVARGNLEADELALHRVLDRVGTAWLEPADLAVVDPEGRALRNVNTPEELLAVERELAAG